MGEGNGRYLVMASVSCPSQVLDPKVRDGEEPGNHATGFRREISGGRQSTTVANLTMLGNP